VDVWNLVFHSNETEFLRIHLSKFFTLLSYYPRGFGSEFTPSETRVRGLAFVLFAVPCTTPPFLGAAALPHALIFTWAATPSSRVLSRSSKTYDNQKLSKLQQNKHSEQYTVSAPTVSELSQLLRHTRPAVFRQAVFRHGFLFMRRLQDRTPPTNVFNRSVSFQSPSFYQFSCSDLINFSNSEAQRPNEKLIIRNPWIRKEMLFITRMGEERRREKSLVWDGSGNQ
jgi:hypothetical protein